MLQKLVEAMELFKCCSKEIKGIVNYVLRVKKKFFSGGCTLNNYLILHVSPGIIRKKVHTLLPIRRSMN